MVYEAGWYQDGIVGPAQLGTSGYLFEAPDDLWYSRYWQLIVDGALDDARALWRERLAQFAERGSWMTNYPGRPDYFTHWGEAFKLAASVIGLPIGDYPYSRPPQARLPEEGRQQIIAAYESSGIAGKARVGATA
jgi:4-hydroxy-tetrahydrodipicolinate synthase